MTHALCTARCHWSWSSTLIRFFAHTALPLSSFYSLSFSFYPLPRAIYFVRTTLYNISESLFEAAMLWAIHSRCHDQRRYIRNEREEEKNNNISSKCNYGLSLNSSSLWNFVIKNGMTSRSKHPFPFTEFRPKFSAFLLFYRSPKKTPFSIHIFCFKKCFVFWSDSILPMSIVFCVYASVLVFFFSLFNPCELKALSIKSQRT